MLRITIAYKHLGTNIPNSTIVTLKAAYTAYVPPADGQFERVVTVGASAFTEAECVVVCARALRRGRQPVDALGHTCARAAAERPQDACREFVQEYLDREKERNRLEEILGFYA